MFARPAGRAPLRSSPRTSPERRAATPNLPTKIIPTKRARLELSGKSPLGLGIPSLNIKILLESNPLKSRILVRRLAVRRSLPTGRGDCGGGAWNGGQRTSELAGNSPPAAPPPAAPLAAPPAAPPTAPPGMATQDDQGGAGVQRVQHGKPARSRTASAVVLGPHPCLPFLKWRAGCHLGLRKIHTSPH